MIEEKEIYLLNVEIQPLTPKGDWDDNFDPQWVVMRFYDLREGIHAYNEYANLERTRSIFLNAPIRSMDTPVLEADFTFRKDDREEHVYSVGWSKTYVSSGTVQIKASSPEEADEIAHENIGDYVGSMEYQPECDSIESVSLLETSK